MACCRIILPSGNQKRSRRDSGAGLAVSSFPRAHWLLKTRRETRTVRSRSEEHTSELQSHSDLVCRLLLEKKKKDGGKIVREGALVGIDLAIDVVMDQPG